MGEIFRSFIAGREAGEDRRHRQTQRTALDEAGQLYGLGKTDAAENALVGAGMPDVAASYSALGEHRRARQTRQRATQAAEEMGPEAAPTARIDAMADAYLDAGDPEQARALQEYSNSIDDRQRQTDLQRLAFTGSLQASLQEVPMEQRLARVRELIAQSPYASDPHMQALGDDDTADLSDEALSAGARATMSAESILAGRERRERYAVEDSHWGQEMGLRRAALDAQQASRMLSAEEAQRMGFRPGSVVAVDRRGMPHVLQDSLGFTDGEQNASAFANRMTGAETALTQLEQDGVAPANIWARGGFSREARLYRQAMGEWIAAQLRKDTGAAVTPQEFEMYGRIYFPVPGDTPEQIEQKRQSRARAFQGVIAASGGAYHSTFGGGAGAPLMDEALRGTPYAINTERRRGNLGGAMAGDQSGNGGWAQGQQIPQEAISILRQNPSRERRAVFDRHFGAGASAHALGERDLPGFGANLGPRM